MTRQPCARLDRNAGFTLIELILVMVLASVLAVTLAPRMDMLGGFGARGYADQLEANLRYAQKTALAQRRLTAVVVPASSATDVTYCVASAYSSAPTCPANCAGWTPIAIPSSRSRPTSTVSLTGSGTVCFYPDNGRPSVALTLAIQSNGATVRTVVVEAGTGYVHSF